MHFNHAGFGLFINASMYLMYVEAYFLITNQTLMSKWSNFYAGRINSSYQDYFEQRYRPLLNMLINYNTVVEEGVGIGSISKFIRTFGIRTIGIDKCPEMVKLCQQNNPGMSVYCNDIFHNTVKAGIVVTHGVIEHFSDEMINKLLYKYKSMDQKSVHYVPTNGYDKPSFGDERLLPVEYWVETFKPSKHIVFNDGKDLLLIF